MNNGNIDITVNALKKFLSAYILGELEEALIRKALSQDKSVLIVLDFIEHTIKTDFIRKHVGLKPIIDPIAVCVHPNPDNLPIWFGKSAHQKDTTEIFNAQLASALLRPAKVEPQSTQASTS